MKLSFIPQQNGPSVAARMSAAKVQGFMKGGLVDCRREDSPIYYQKCIWAEVYSDPSSAIQVLAGSM